MKTKDQLLSEKTYQAYENFQRKIEKITGEKRPVMIGKWTINKPITKP